MTNSKTNYLPWGISAILAVALLAMIWQWHKLSEQNQTYRTELAEVQSEKQTVKTELDELLTEYQQMESSNEQVNKQLRHEQAKIEAMILELKKVKTSNATVIARYKREVKTLRKVMRSFVRQIDSLNTKNKHLTAKVNRTEKKYEATLKDKQSLQNQSDSLQNQVQKAEVLKAENITVIALNKRSNKTKRASKAQKIKVSFSLRDNPVAARGERTIYLRVIHHESAGLDRILDNNIQSGLFDFVNISGDTNNAGYSAKLKLDYQGKKTEATIFFDITGKAPKGKYTIMLFTDNSSIGAQNFKLR